jgi:hypothetical protein
VNGSHLTNYCYNYGLKEESMDMTVFATIGFTSLAALGILYLFLSMRKK